MWSPRSRLEITGVGVVLANLVPLVGVVWLDWTLATLLAVYWLEVGVLILESLAKVVLAAGADDPAALSGEGGFFETDAEDLVGAPKWKLVSTALVWYGVVWFFQGMFVFFFLRDFLGPPGDLAPGVLALAVPHLTAFGIDFLYRGEYERTGPVAQALAPQGHVWTFTAVLVVGTLVLVYLGTPLAALVAFVAIKTAVDLRSYSEREGDRQRRERPDRGID